MQSELIALQGAIHDLKNLKSFEETKIFKLNMYVIKMAYGVQIE